MEMASGVCLNLLRYFKKAKRRLSEIFSPDKIFSKKYQLTAQNWLVPLLKGIDEVSLFLKNIPS